jgi:predicted HicB family RNase H-like nuclease
MPKGESDILQLRVPQELKRQLAMDAATKGTTIRSLILTALSASGYDIPDEEIRDKRKGRA